ncbi:hypothetical protein LOTGIDRAFT_231139 [Lottia gigantea]|uniref:Schlafen AlbA-2 domain-containing protein n=1 Tax=Lottia gigantea TaxID=225164 RepID=V4AYI0_LOTGI|nr:hypothetical protein LOTGIDRAFT_231139 [Lottia gigantea]ESO98716.1 hypothetical protein LOTGIDRAFT_231139 [Lottia gigantea]
MENELEVVDSATQHRSIVEYLSEVCGIRTDKSARLAAMTMLSDLLRSVQVSVSTKRICIQSGILENLDDILDLPTSASYIDNMSILHIKLALQIIWELSFAPVCVQEPLVDKKFLAKIVSFIKLADSPLLRYDKAGTQFLKKLCEGKQIIGQISGEFVQMEMSVIDNEANYFMKQSMMLCPSQIKECRLFDTCGEDDVDISDVFITERHAIHKESKLTFTDDSWKDILVTNVVAGPYFWAQIGEKVILTAQKIQLLLASDDLKLTTAHVGQYVAVKHDDSYFRCRVLNNYGEHVVVMAVDYGMVVLVEESMVFALPESVGIMVYQPQVKLYCLSGVAPPLLDTDIQQVALGILVNLARQKVVIGISLNNMKIMEVLKKTLFCKIPSLVLQSLSLLNNLLSNPRMGNKLPVVDIIKWVLEICEDVASLNVSKALQEKLSAACLSCLSTLLFKNRQKRNDFYLNHGLEVTVRLAGDYPKPSIVYNRVVRVLKNYIITFDKTAREKTPPRKTQYDDISPIRSRHCSNENKVIFKSISIEDESSSDDEVNHSELPRLNISHSVNTALFYNDTSTDTDIKYIRDIKYISLLLFNTDIDIRYNRALLVFNTDTNIKYNRDSDTGLRDSVIVEIRENTTLETISVESLSEITCAMFNSGKGGTIYFGINKEGIVKGLYLNRDERDELRMGIDQMMNERIHPSILHYQFTVSLKPVIDVDDKGDQIKREDLYVVEIYLESKPGMFYSCNRTKRCFYRFGDKTSLIHTQDIRELIVLEEESKYKKEITMLEKKLEELKIMLISLKRIKPHLQLSMTEKFFQNALSRKDA